MSFVVIQPKIQATTIPISVDFISQLVLGEALVSSDVTLSVFSGTDASPSSMLLGSSTLAQNTITQTFTGGVVGVVYLLNFAAGTNYGNSIVIQAYLAVLDQTPFSVP